MNHSQAQYILEECYEEALSFQPNHKTQFDQCIDMVLASTHKTFKYILFTQLLAKATDSKIDTLSLQKKDYSSGAYDARSLCHKVIVPFEKTVLDKVLGGSNEPFLNKPARFPRLDPSNAVRRGKDKEILDILCTNLPTLTSSDLAHRELVYFLFQLIQLKEIKERDRNFSIPKSSNTIIKLSEFIMAFLQESHGGETLVLVVAGLYDLLYSKNSSIKIEVHPVNESGTSSKEISDLDIFQNGILDTANELKDKLYSETDVRHAVDKVIEAGGKRLYFIQGLHAKPIDDHWMPKLIMEYQSQDFWLEIAYIETFSRILLGMIPSSDLDANRFVHYIRELAEETKFKKETIERIDLLAHTILEMHR